MKIYVAILSTLFVASAFSMGDAAETRFPVPRLSSTVIKGSITKHYGIVGQSNSGKLCCEVSYDSNTQKYKGSLINDGYSRAEWYSQGLNENTAQQYFEQLKEQSQQEESTK